MQVAILGGSFDPPHIGHMFIASQVKEFVNLDQVLLMPVYQHAFIKKLTDVKHRLAMTRFLENDYIKVSSYEIEQQKTSYTIDTLDGLTKKYPQDTFFWILGSDQLNVFQQYKNWQEVLKRYNLIVFPREYILSHLEEKVKESFQLQTIPENVTVMHNKGLILTNISSTAIRKRVKNNLTIHNFVPEKVEAYIEKEGLYRD